jgi:hypothetical protein
MDGWPRKFLDASIRSITQAKYPKVLKILNFLSQILIFLDCWIGDPCLAALEPLSDGRAAHGPRIRAAV